jgi:hypothetical protein
MAEDGIEITPELAMALRERGLVIVPREPSQTMIEAGKASAWAEDAAGVWRDMIVSALEDRKTIGV